MLSKEQENIIIEVLKPFNPIYIGLFGSFSRNEENNESDIDILYEFGNKISLFDIIDMKDTLKQRLNKNIDLVSKKYLNKNIKPQVEKDLKIIFNA